MTIDTLKHDIPRHIASCLQRLGCNTNELVICQPDHGEMALNIMDELVRSGSVDMIVVDSVSALTPRSEIEGDIGTPQVVMATPLPVSNHHSAAGAPR